MNDCQLSKLQGRHRSVIEFRGAIPGTCTYNRASTTTTTGLLHSSVRRNSKRNVLRRALVYSDSMKPFAAAGIQLSRGIIGSHFA